MTTVVTAGRLVGTPVRRKEDTRLLTGAGRFLDDLQLPGMLHLAVLRSPYAHARLDSVNLQGALGMSGVAAAVSGKQLVDQVSPLDVLFHAPGLIGVPPMYPLAVGDTRHVGEGIAAVVASSRYEAEDALEAIQVEYTPLPAVTGLDSAAAPGAPMVHDGFPNNLVFERQLTTGNVEGAMAAADVVIRDRFSLGRNAGIPLERRGVIAQYDRATQQFTVWCTHQTPHLQRLLLAKALGVAEQDVRVIVNDVGGGFGVYTNIWPEDVLVCLLARRLGHPVKFVEDRRETLISTLHGGDMVLDAELAALNDGTILGVRVNLKGDMGAYLDCGTAGPHMLGSVMLPGCYRFAAYQIDVKCYLTNKTRYGAFRGFGQGETNFVMEGMVDRLARRLDMDSAEVRRRNFIRPEEFPFCSATGQLYDSGDYPKSLDMALEKLGYDAVRDEQRRLRQAGRYVGIGLACYVEATGSGPNAHMARLGCMMPGHEPATVRVDATGRVQVISGVCPTGQSLETTLAQVCADELSIDLEHVRVVFGDTEKAPWGTRGSVASRSAVVAGSAVLKAAQAVKEKALTLAGYLLGEHPKNLRLAGGQIWVVGCSEPALSLGQIAYEAYLSHRLPPGMEPGLEAQAIFEPEGLAYANGVHACLVEVDPRTCRVEVRRYVIIHDCGRVINPLVVEGQIVGGAAQSIGRALLEEVRYDSKGQPLTATLMDYLLPTATDVPRFELGHLESPSPRNPLGLKGCGEGGSIPPYAALANAVSDALAPLGIEIRELPLSPERIFRLIRSAL